MQKHSRRRFLKSTGNAITAVSLLGSPLAAAASPKADRLFIHHVYFWLNNHDSKEDRAKLLAGLQKLSKVKTIKSFHVGEPAATNRDVIDHSYSISWCLFFNNKADQDAYQVDPIHLNFVKECSSLWTRVVVYDAEDISFV